jgi:hypothetical protein
MKALEELAIDHPYYCSDSNYYSNDPGGVWNSWGAFYNEYKDSDIDMNLIFRFDLKKSEEPNTYYLKAFMIHQRKGIFAPHLINNITESDIPTITELLQKHYETILKMWEPFKPII